MQIDIISIFVEYFEPLRLSLVGKAIENGLVDLQVHDQPVLDEFWQCVGCGPGALFALRIRRLRQD